MIVLTLPAEPAHAGNCVVVDGTAYVVARVGARSFVLGARCPHRGGPMHLAELDPTARSLVCPMHGRRMPVSRCVTDSVPAVRSGSRVTAVFPQPAGATVTRRHLPLSGSIAPSR